MGKINADELKEKSQLSLCSSPRRTLLLGHLGGEPGRALEREEIPPKARRWQRAKNRAIAGDGGVWDLQGGGREGQHPSKKSRDMREKAGKGSTPCPQKSFTPQAQTVCP